MTTAVADATQEDHLVEPSDNGPEPGMDVPPQDPSWVPESEVDQ